MWGKGKGYKQMMTSKILNKAVEEMEYYLSLAREATNDMQVELYRANAWGVWDFVKEYTDNADTRKMMETMWEDYNRQYEKELDRVV